MKKSASTFRILAIILSLALSVGILAACGGSDNAGTSQQPGGSSPAPGGSSPAPGGSSPAPGGSSPAPGGNSPAPDVRYADSIEILTESTFAVLDPYNPRGVGSAIQSVYSCVYDKLVNNANGEFIPELATSWETDDYKTYTFHLRDDVYFSNGDKFTAQSVVETCEVGMEIPGITAYDLWRLVDNMTVVDEYTVKMVLTDTNVDFIFRLTSQGGNVVNKRARAEDPVEGAWVGTGAYTVSEFSSDNIVLIRNDNYWGGLMPTRQMTFRFLPEVASRAIALQNGDSQVSLDLSPQDMPFFEESDDFNVIPFVSNVMNSVGFNVTDPITGDLNFRKAVAYGVNGPEIALVSSGNYAIPVPDGSFWGYGTEFRNTAIPLIPYDIDLATQYLAASNYSGEEIEIVSGNPDTNRGSQLIQEQLKKIGINTSLYQTDNPTISAYARYDNNQAQMLFYLNNFTYIASSARSTLYPNGTQNTASYNNQAVADLIDRGPTIVDTKEREAMYKQLQETIVDDMPYYGVYYIQRCITTVSGFGGIIVNPDSWHIFRGAYVELKD